MSTGMAVGGGLVGGLLIGGKPLWKYLTVMSPTTSHPLTC
jgi:hypothetical protein